MYRSQEMRKLLISIQSLSLHLLRALQCTPVGLEEKVLPSSILLAGNFETQEQQAAVIYSQQKAMDQVTGRANGIYTQCIPCDPLQSLTWKFYTFGGCRPFSGGGGGSNKPNQLTC